MKISPHILTVMVLGVAISSIANPAISIIAIIASVCMLFMKGLGKVMKAIIIISLVISLACFIFLVLLILALG